MDSPRPPFWTMASLNDASSAPLLRSSEDLTLFVTLFVVEAKLGEGAAT